MDVFEDMRIFVSAVDLHGFSAAAERLGLSKQFVSRRIGALEERLGVRLLTRTTRKLSVTELGRIYYSHAAKILDDVSEADLAVTSRAGHPRGLLRVSAPMSFGTMYLNSLMPQFLLLHPDVSLELDLSDRAVDIVGEGYDMAIRIAALADSTLIARPIAPVRMRVCCSPDYLVRHGAPQRPEDLKHHACILSSQSRSVEWHFTERGKVRTVPLAGRIRLNNGELARDAAVAGLGIAYLPTFITVDALRSGALLPLLDDFPVPESAVYSVYPQHRQSSQLIRAFTDFLQQHFERQPGW